jgi:8-oxo-dGTP pyrophosphatase MutT (NUDIX family)
MRRRFSARVLLFDPLDRLLLLKSSDALVDALEQRPRRVFWYTLGGEIEAGESLLEAARRELQEEAGIVDVEFGPTVWRGERPLRFSGETFLSCETYVVARTEQTQVSSAGWTELERTTHLELRWWTLDELEQTDATIFPRVLTQLIRQAASAREPCEPQTIALG